MGEKSRLSVEINKARQEGRLKDVDALLKKLIPRGREEAEAAAAAKAAARAKRAPQEKTVQIQPEQPTYKVKTGDNWFKIAEEVYGDPRMALALARENKGFYVLHAGMVLDLPEYRYKEGELPGLSYELTAEEKWKMDELAETIVAADPEGMWSRDPESVAELLRQHAKVQAVGPTEKGPTGGVRALLDEGYSPEEIDAIYEGYEPRRTEEPLPAPFDKPFDELTEAIINRMAEKGVLPEKVEVLGDVGSEEQDEKEIKGKVGTLKTISQQGENEKTAEELLDIRLETQIADLLLLGEENFGKSYADIRREDDELRKRLQDGSVTPKQIEELVYGLSAESSILVPTAESTPTPSPTATPTPGPTPFTYIVQEGDTVNSIADRFNVPSEDIIELNKLPNPDEILVNQELKIAELPRYPTPTPVPALPLADREGSLYRELHEKPLNYPKMIGGHRFIGRDVWGAKDLSPGYDPINSEGLYDKEKMPKGYYVYGEDEPLNEIYYGIVIHDTGVLRANWPTTSIGQIQSIQEFHQSPPAKDVYGNYIAGTGNEFADIGYHFLIATDGTILEARDIRARGAHVSPVVDQQTGEVFGNTGTIGIAYVGDDSQEEPTAAQLDALKALVGHLVEEYSNITVVAGHGGINAEKEEEGNEVAAWLAEQYDTLEVKDFTP